MSGLKAHEDILKWDRYNSIAHGRWAACKFSLQRIRESDQSREGMICGLDVEPEVAFRDGPKIKRKKHENTKITISNNGGQFGRRNERQCVGHHFGQRF